MIALLGDVHGEWLALQQRVAKAAELGASAVIQLGDFGYGNYRPLMNVITLPIPVYFIDGNHEIHEELAQYQESPAPVSIRHNLWFVPRGTVVELDGVRYGCLGGAGSIDKDIRLREGYHWSEREQITGADIVRAGDMGPVDVMLTHCPPQSFIAKHFETAEKKAFKVRMFGVSPDWFDPSATMVEVVRAILGNPPLYCGHMHEAITDPGLRVRALNILELVMHPEATS